MRITGTRMMDRAAAATSANQRQVADRADELTSGLRVQTPSVDPAAWMAAQRASVRKALTTGGADAIATSRERLDETDRALATVLDAVSQARTLAVQGGNDSYGAVSRKEMATQVRALFASALAAANTRATDGEYLLAGSASMTAPFDATGAYQGDAVTRALPTSDGATSAVMLAGTELTAANGVDVLPLIERVALALEANDGAGVRALLGELQTAIDQVALSRTRGGNAMATLDDAARAHGELADALQGTIARNVEADPIAAASGLAKATQALEASRAVSEHVISLLKR